MEPQQRTPREEAGGVSSEASKQSAPGQDKTSKRRKKDEDKSNANQLVSKANSLAVPNPFVRKHFPTLIIDTAPKSSAPVTLKRQIDGRLEAQELPAQITAYKSAKGTLRCVVTQCPAAKEGVIGMRVADWRFEDGVVVVVLEDGPPAAVESAAAAGAGWAAAGPGAAPAVASPAAARPAAALTPRPAAGAGATPAAAGTPPSAAAPVAEAPRSAATAGGGGGTPGSVKRPRTALELSPPAAPSPPPQSAAPKTMPAAALPLDAPADAAGAAAAAAPSPPAAAGAQTLAERPAAAARPVDHEPIVVGKKGWLRLPTRLVREHFRSHASATPPPPFNVQMRRRVRGVAEEKLFSAQVVAQPQRQCPANGLPAYHFWLTKCSDFGEGITGMRVVKWKCEGGIVSLEVDDLLTGGAAPAPVPATAATPAAATTVPEVPAGQQAAAAATFQGAASQAAARRETGEAEPSAPAEVPRSPLICGKRRQHSPQSRPQQQQPPLAPQSQQPPHQQQQQQQPELQAASSAVPPAPAGPGTPSARSLWRRAALLRQLAAELHHVAAQRQQQAGQRDGPTKAAEGGADAADRVVAAAHDGSSSRSQRLQAVLAAASAGGAAAVARIRVPLAVRVQRWCDMLQRASSGGEIAVSVEDMEVVRGRALARMQQAQAMQVAGGPHPTRQQQQQQPELSEQQQQQQGACGSGVRVKSEGVANEQLLPCKGPACDQQGAAAAADSAHHECKRHPADLLHDYPHGQAVQEQQHLLACKAEPEDPPALYSQCSETPGTYATAGQDKPAPGATASARAATAATPACPHHTGPALPAPILAASPAAAVAAVSAQPLDAPSLQALQHVADLAGVLYRDDALLLAQLRLLDVLAGGALGAALEA